MEKEKKQNQEGKVKEEYRRSILLFLRFSGWIAGPVIIAAIAGNWLDEKYNTDPWIFLSAIGVAFIFSMIGLVKETLKEYRKIEKENNKENGNNNNKTEN